MKGIVYLSQAKIEFSEENLTELPSVSSQKNEALGITGYLCFLQNRFIQYIEGKTETVTSLMEIIKMDKRHTVIHQIEKQNLTNRKFPAWGMRYITADELLRFNIELYIAQNTIYIKD